MGSAIKSKPGFFKAKTGFVSARLQPTSKLGQQPQIRQSLATRCPTARRGRSSDKAPLLEQRWHDAHTSSRITCPPAAIARFVDPADVGHLRAILCAESHMSLPAATSIGSQTLMPDSIQSGINTSTLPSESIS